MRNRIDLRTLFQSLEDPTVPPGLAERIMRQVAASGRPAATPAPSPILPFEIPRWARLPLAVSAAAAVLALTGAAWLVPSSWLGLLDGLQASLTAAVWLLTLAAAVLAESVAFLNGAVRVGEALDLVLNTPAATITIAVVTLLCLTGVHLLHRLSRAPVHRPQGRGFRAGALLLAFGLCCTGMAFGQPQQESDAQEAREEAAEAIEEVRERLDEALEEADERAQGAVEDAIERIEDLERDLAEAEAAGGESGPVVRVDLDNKVAFGSTVRVGRDEVANDITSIGGGIKVDGEVRGDAVAIGGEAKIDGRVTGEVVAIGGDVELGPEAEVLGDIVTVGGRVSREEGATVLGEISEVDWGDFEWDWDGDWFDGWSGDWFPRVGERPPFFRVGKVFEFVRAIIFTGLLIVLGGLVLLVSPKGVDRVRAAAVSDPLIMLVVGFGIELLILPALIVASILLAVTVIGIPFAILLWPAALVALALALVLGYTGAAAAAGDWFRNRFKGASGVAAGSFGALALGVLTIQALALVADLLGFLGLPWFFRFMFGFPGLVICYLAWTIGLGAACMTAFGTSRFGAKAAQTVPPTPPAASDADDGPEPPADNDPTPAVPEPPDKNDPAS
ncbi:MAG: polymer-forming cytoskeletal protein [Acidobacteriota bacterium]|nr:polymer-forming cytoskeletal protein [Acidobacteriota bacterium]MDE3264436.1 polymer-forming cytoskeletal protein [Acidobacteriota bacterium]